MAPPFRCGVVAALALLQSLGCIAAGTPAPLQCTCSGGWKDGSLWDTEHILGALNNVTSEADCLEQGLKKFPDGNYVDYWHKKSGAGRCIVKKEPVGKDPLVVQLDDFPDLLRLVYNEIRYCKVECEGVAPTPSPTPAPTPAPFWPPDCGVKTCSGGWKDGSLWDTEHILGALNNVTSEADCLEQGLTKFPNGNYVDYWHKKSGAGRCIVKQEPVGKDPLIVQLDDFPDLLRLVYNQIRYCKVQCRPPPTPAPTPSPTPAATPLPTTEPVPCKPKGWYCHHLCATLGKDSGCEATCEEHVSELKGALRKYCEGCGRAVLAEADDAQAAAAEWVEWATEEASLLQRAAPDVQQVVAPEVLVAERHEGSGQKLAHYCEVLCVAIGEKHRRTRSALPCCVKRCVLKWHSDLKPVLDTLCREGTCPPAEPSLAEAEEEPTSLFQNPVAGRAEL